MDLAFLAFAIFFFFTTIILLVQILPLKRKVDLIDLIDKKTKSLLAIIDAHSFHVLSASAALRQVLGFSSEELKQHSMREFIFPDDEKLLNTALESSLNKDKTGYAGETTIEHLRLRLKDVRYGWQWYELFGFFTTYNSKRILCCTYMPLNEQILTKADLIEKENLLKVLMNNSFGIIWTMDCLSRQLMLLTPISRERFGIDDHPIGAITSNEEVFTADTLQRFRAMINQRIELLASNGEERDLPQDLEITVQNRDGSTVNMITRSTLEKNDLGKYILYGISLVVPKK